MQKNIKDFIENTSTNPRWGCDLSQIDFSAHENFIISSKYQHASDAENLYYNLVFRDISLEEFNIQLTPIISVKHGILKVSPSGEMTILNQNLGITNTSPLLEDSNDLFVSALIFSGALYAKQQFTNARFEFDAANNKLIFRNGFDMEREKIDLQRQESSCRIS